MYVLSFDLVSYSYKTQNSRFKTLNFAEWGTLLMMNTYSIYLIPAKPFVWAFKKEWQASVWYLESSWGVHYSFSAMYYQMIF